MSLRSDIARGDDGFSLIELLAAMLIGGMLLTALMTVFINGVQGSTKVLNRVDSAQRGRVALDRINTLLNAQVCLRDASDATTQAAIPPVVGASSSGSVITFYADLDGASDTPDKYVLTYDATAKTITETRYNGIGKLTDVNGVTFSSTATYNRRLADYISPSKNTAGTVLPIFTYYGFASNGTVDLANPTDPDLLAC
jgi:prepilin-type N-terminal cleavage/methylation domain-containing protein